MTKTFGNTFEQLNRVLIVGAIFTVLLSALFAGTAIYHGHLEKIWIVLPVALLIGSIVPLCVLPTLLFSIQISELTIKHLLCGKWVLSEYSIIGLKEVRIGYSTGVTFCFKNGRKINFIGAHLRILMEMIAFIRELRPGFRGFKFGPRAQFLLHALKKINPSGK